MAQLVQEQNVVVLERQAAHRAGLHAYETDLQAQTQTADFNQREAQFREAWMFLRQECQIDQGQRRVDNGLGCLPRHYSRGISGVSSASKVTC